MSINTSILVDANPGITADVDAAVAAATGLRLVGWNIRESAASAAAASAKIVHGATGAGGTVIAALEVAANGSKSQWLWPGIDCASGLSIDHLSGTLDINLYYTIIT